MSEHSTPCEGHEGLQRTRVAQFADRLLREGGPVSEFDLIDGHGYGKECEGARERQGERWTERILVGGREKSLGAYICGDPAYYIEGLQAILRLRARYGMVVEGSGDARPTGGDIRDQVWEGAIRGSSLLVHMMCSRLPP